MASLPTLNVYVDLNSDGDYIDASEDISAYVMSANISIGFGGQYQNMGRDNTATITLRNSDKRFSPESGSVFSTNWSTGRKLKITTTDPTGPTTRTMYIGWIDEIKPAPDTTGARTCTVVCSGFFKRIQNTEAFVALQENKTADVVIAALVGAGNVYPPVLFGRWLLGVSGWGELGSTTTLGASSDWLVAETGKTSFIYIGDKWGEGVSVYGALRDIVGREGGRAFVNRDGYLVFTNRHHFILDITSDATFNETMYALEYGFGGDIINRMTVRYHPRSVGVAPEILSRQDRYLQVDAGQSVTVDYRYTDLTASGAKIGGRNILTPVASTDYYANTASDGTGSDVTASVSASLVAETATKASIKFTNSTGATVYILTGSTVRGTAIRDFGAQSVTVDNETSQITNGLRPSTYGAEMDNYADALGMGQYLVSARSRARGQVKSITLNARYSAALMTQALSRTVLDHITITEGQTGVSADYFIIGEQHSFAPGEYRVKWLVEDAAGTAAWVLGSATLGETTFIGPY